jgi:hypothetical protein
MQSAGCTRTVKLRSEGYLLHGIAEMIHIQQVLTCGFEADKGCWRSPGRVLPAK